MRALARFFLVLGPVLAAAGCLGGPPSGPAPSAGAHAASLDRVRGDDDADPGRAALATELWCETCVEDGLRARSLAHDVRFHTSQSSADVFVEIDGALACAGRASDPGVVFEVQLEGDAQAQGGQDEGNPDPEPALDDELPPSPAPPPQVRQKGEDEGNPDPEPALDDALPGSRPDLGDPGSFGGTGT